ncbi:MAG: putative MATE family efflux protein [Myxococcota bacterium]|jgi:putative MATE family efflux protein
MMLLGLLRSAYFIVDTYWVAGLGSDALAALGGCAFAWWMILIASDLAGQGVHSLIARAAGAGRRVEIPAHAAQAVWVALATTALFVAIWPARSVYLDLIGFSPASAEYALGADFLGASMLGAGATAAHLLVGSVFRALGHTRTALVVTAATLVVNAILDPLLIHGILGVPALGIAGAAWATTVANAVGTAIGLALLARDSLTIPLHPPRAAELLRIVRIGAPVTAHGLGFSLVYVWLGSMITDFGAFQMAAVGVGHRIESLAYLVAVGMSVGAATLVGQSLGAGQPRRAQASARAAAIQCSVAMVPFALAFGFMGDRLVGLLIDDPAIVAAGGLYLAVQAPVLVFMGLETVYDGAFTGAGHTQPPFWIGTTLTAARIPIASLLAYDLEFGVVGIWFAIAASTTVKGLAMWVWFQRKTWDREA